ncbi:hypothetical protein GCM10009603_66260 [Nocardiopsis exhalans]
MDGNFGCHPRGSPLYGPSRSADAFPTAALGPIRRTHERTAPPTRPGSSRRTRSACEAREERAVPAATFP